MRIFSVMGWIRFKLLIIRFLNHPWKVTTGFFAPAVWRVCHAVACRWLVNSKKKKQEVYFMNVLKAEDIVSTTILARYARQESVITIDNDPTTGESRISATYDPDLAQMEALDLIDLLECVEVDCKYLSGNQPEDRRDQIWLWQEKLRQTKLLMEEIKDEMVARIRAVRNQNCCGNWVNYVDSCPSMGLMKPEDFILYSYVHGEFPNDMDSCDMEKVRRELQDQLDALLEDEEGDEYWSYQCEQKRVQLAQIKELVERCIPEDDGVRMDHGEEDAGEPVFLAHLFFAPDTAELNQRELVGAIEQMQCHLLSRESEREGDALQRSAWEFERSQIQGMLDELNRRILRKLGVVELQSEEDEPEEFRQDHSITSWVRGSELETVEDIIACWYLSDAFPWGLSCDQLLQIQQKLKEQVETLEAEESEYEELDALDLWRFRRDIKAEQLEQVQTKMRNCGSDCGE